MRTTLGVALVLSAGFPAACFPQSAPAAGGPPAAGQSLTGTQPQAAGQQELAKQLANPISSLISVPFQSNFDSGIGEGLLPSGLFRYTLNVQPVIPFSFSKNWNVISRTIFPIIYLDEPLPGVGSQFGSGDTIQSFFFSPKKSRDGVTWGLGPVFLLPTASETLLGSEKFGIGPTAVLLKQRGPWTIGMLANQIWSVAGSSDRRGVSSTYLQPFLAYTTKQAVTYTLSSESTYDWKASQWGVPVIVQVSKLTKVGKQPVSVGLGFKYWAVENPSTPEWGVRLTVTLLYPRVRRPRRAGETPQAPERATAALHPVLDDTRSTVKTDGD